MTTAALAPSENTIEWCRKLIRHQSVSMTPNLALIDEVKAFLDGLGYDTLVVRDPTDTKANLYATIGPDVAGGVILSGHSDVVPTEGQNWASDPYEIDIRDDKLYGRGSCDMKGFLACLLAKAEPLRTPTFGCQSIWLSPMTRKSAVWVCQAWSRRSTICHTNRPCASSVSRLK